MSPYLSKTISILRFPIILGPVFIHCRLGSDSVLSIFLAEMLGCVTVPLFFLVSGFLFFQNFLSVKDSFIGKLKSRIRSLLIPYLLWNLLAFAVYCALGEMRPEQFLQSFWVVDGKCGHSPADGPLWFVRTLMMLSLMTPIMFYLNSNKYLRWHSVVLLLCCVLGVPYFNRGIVLGYVYFNLGCFWGVSAKSSNVDLSGSRTLFYVLLFLYVVVCCCDFILGFPQIRNVELLVCMAVFLLLPSAIPDRVSDILEKLGVSSFFVYCFHEPTIPFLQRFCFSSNSTVNHITLILLVLGCSLAVFYLLKKTCPRILLVLCGGRY